jgi:hypothetical protein
MEERDHECNKRFCTQCLKKRKLGHKCYISSLSDSAPRSVRVLYVFYESGTTQNTKCSDTSSEHVPNLV